jgi:hypothetical protein
MLRCEGCEVSFLVAQKGRFSEEKRSQRFPSSLWIWGGLRVRWKQP